MAVLPIRNLNQQNALTAGQLQPAAQANVPVIPNNGNPAGANNMPGALAPKASIPSFFQYSVSNPSPYMQAMTSLLGSTQTQQPLAAEAAPPAQAAEPVPAVLPMRAVPSSSNMSWGSRLARAVLPLRVGL